MSDPQSLFPLRMTSIEQLHFFDDHPHFPNNIFARLHFRGFLEPQLTQSAFAIAVSRHVWGNSVVRRGSLGWYWHQDNSAQPKFIWSDGSPESNFAPIDLSRESCCRVVCQPAAEGTMVTWQVHHAAVDGQGGMQFVRDWLLIYENLVEGRHPESGLIPLELDRLKLRNRLGLLSRRYLSQSWKQPLGLFGAAKFLFRRFETLLSDEANAGTADPLANVFPTIHSFQVDAGTIAKLKRHCKHLGIQMNDWLLSSLFRTVRRWRREQGLGSPADCFRIIVPVSIRTPDDRWLPAANRASLVQLDRRDIDAAHPCHLGQGIHYELNLIRNWLLDRFFLLSVRLTNWAPGLLRRTVQANRRRATTMLTNLGKPLLRTGLTTNEEGKIQVGSLVLERLELIAPIRQAMPISFAVVEYAGELTMTLHYDHRLISPATATQIQRIYREELEVFEPPNATT